MEKSSYYFLAALVVLAPHLGQRVALLLSIPFLIIAALHAWEEIKGHMREAERKLQK